MKKRYNSLKSIKHNIIFLLLIILSSSVFGQDKDTIHSSKIIPIPMLGYTPETNWYFGAGAIYTFHLGERTANKLSNAKLEFNYSLNKQIILELEGMVHALQNKLIFSFNNSYQKYPEKFYLPGYNSPDESEIYQANRLELDNTIYYSLHKNLMFGLTFRLQNMSNMVLPENTSLFDESIIGINGGTCSGIGYNILIDNRNPVLNPRGGDSYYSFSQTFFSRFSGSDYNYNHWKLDVRKYFSLIPKGILALQLYAASIQGQAPFRMLELIGGENYMRGYYHGRYRDNSAYSLQAEIRLPIYRFIGITAFGGMGSIGAKPADFFNQKPLPSYGIGLRLEFDKEEKTNIRFDMGFGKESNGFYISFGEAF